MEKIFLGDNDYQDYLGDKEIIGNGYESIVYSFGDEVLKVFNEEFQNDSIEARISKLSSMNDLGTFLTIPTKSLYLNSHFIGYFMNYAGIDLKKYIIQSNPSFEDKVKILKIIKEKVLSLHKLGMVHGDLQLKNIMFYDGVIKISDFVNAMFGNYNDALLNDMTLYLSKYFGMTFLLDLHSLNYITHILLNMPESEMLVYIDMDAYGYSYLLENGAENKVFPEDIFEEQMEFLFNPAKNKEYALEKSKYLIDYI